MSQLEILSGIFLFTLAIRSIFMHSMQLEQEDRLGQLLSNWSEINNDQAETIENEFDKLNSQQKTAIFSSIRAGLRTRMLQLEVG